MTDELKPLDFSNCLKHAFLSGVTAARNIPAGDPIDGRALWVEYEPYETGSYTRVVAAIDVMTHRASVLAAAGILDQVEAVQDAYTRWMLSRAVGDPDMEHREAQRLSSALFALFDGGPDPDDKPCALVAALRAIAEKGGE